MLYGLNIAKAISCLLIATFHISEFLRANEHGLNVPVSQTPGIHIFMVISGFMCVVIVRQDDTFLRYMGRRFARLAPLYWLATTIVILFVLWRPWTHYGTDLSWSSILASYFFLPHTDLLGRLHPILFVGWMLNYIIWLNLLYAATLHRPAGARLFILTGAIASIMSVGLLLPPGPWREFLTNPMQLEFAAGVIVATLVADPRVGRWIESHPIWPVTVIGLSCLVVATLSDLTGAARVLACGSAAAVTVFGLVGQDMYRSPFKGAGLWRMGKISYAIYLVHPLLIPVVGAVVLKMIHEVWLTQLLMFAATLSLTVAGAYMAYSFVEKPANEWLRRRMGVAPKPPISQARNAL